MLESFKADWKQYKKTEWKSRYMFQVLKSNSLKYILIGRYSVESKHLSKLWGGVQRYLGQKIGCEIEWENVGDGLILSHPYSITINPNAIIGENCCLFKGCTVGSIRSGRKAGVPIIGNRVTICCNAMVCGGITVGDDVLIAAGAFVNFDVPNNSVVIGNPGVVHHRDNASHDYIDF